MFRTIPEKLPTAEPGSSSNPGPGKTPVVWGLGQYREGVDGCKTAAEPTATTGFNGKKAAVSRPAPDVPDLIDLGQPGLRSSAGNAINFGTGAPSGSTTQLPRDKGSDATHKNAQVIKKARGLWEAAEPEVRTRVAKYRFASRGKLDQFELPDLTGCPKLPTWSFPVIDMQLRGAVVFHFTKGAYEIVNLEGCQQEIKKLTASQQGAVMGVLRAIKARGILHAAIGEVDSKIQERKRYLNGFLAGKCREYVENGIIEGTARIPLPAHHCFHGSEYHIPPEYPFGGFWCRVDTLVSPARRPRPRADVKRALPALCPVIQSSPRANETPTNSVQSPQP